MALAAMAGAVAGCVTDGMIGAEIEGAAQPRVIDTPKTRAVAANAAMDSATKQAAKTNSEKKENARSAAVTPQGDAEMRVAAVRTPEPRETRTAAPAEGPVIPAHTLFGNWTLGNDGGAKCRLILGGVPIGSAYAARSDTDCPQSFASVQTWEIQGDQIVLRSQSRAVVSRLQATGPYRFDGTAEGGATVYLVR